MNKYIFPIFLLGVFLISLLFRIPNLSTPFWVDEFSSSSQALIVNRYGLSALSTAPFELETNNVITHVITAVSFLILGATEYAARIPFVVIGSLVPVLVYMVAYQLTKNKTVGILASIFTSFSYLQIIWSRQARGYMLQEALLLLLIYLYSRLLENEVRYKKALLVLFFLVTVLGVLTHTTFFLAFLGIAIHFLFYNKSKIVSVCKNPLTIISVVSVLIIAAIFGVVQKGFNFIVSLQQTGLSNNVWYYHSFLWREHTLITFLGVIGILLGVLHKSKRFSLLPIIIGVYLAFFFFLFPAYVVRYLLPIFPLIFIGMGIAVTKIADMLNEESKKFVPKKYQILLVSVLPLLLTLGILVNGDTFVVKPKQYYSINHFIREIALLDYDQVYSKISATNEQVDQPVAVIDTWPDRTRWYLGFDYTPIYMLRWPNEGGTVNGISKNTPFRINDKGEKISGRTEATKLVMDLEDVKKIQATYPKGFIWIDDASMPADIISYAETTMKKELYTDHYTLDDNPYSIWPGTLYSWGVE